MSQLGQPPGPDQNQNPQQPQRSEQRFLPRWIVNRRVLYQKESEPFFKECRSKNIHCDGACITPPEGLYPNDKLTLAIYLSDDVAVHVQATVRWVMNHAQDYIVGLQFKNVPAKVQDMILQFAFSCNKEAMIKHWFQGW